MRQRSMNLIRRLLFIALVTCIALGSTGASGQDYFAIQVVDDATGRGVPLVELKTVNGMRYYTDSAGVVAFSEPGLMNQSVYFHVKSHGYEYPNDGFGYRGERLKTKPGGEATLRLKRKNIAQRLYRVTGEGIYDDSLRVGKPAPIDQPLLNAKVLGSDSVVNAVFNGRIHWFWGDTNRPSYPLGNFHVPGAVSQLPNRGGLDPEVGVDLEYFVDEDGFATETARMPGDGPTWIFGLITLAGNEKREELFAAYSKVKPPLDVYERGLARFDDAMSRFEKTVQFDMASPMFPGGHPVKHDDGTGEHVYFADPFPLVRVRATPQDLADLEKYEAYTCLQQGSRDDSLVVQRNNGVPVYGWKTDTIPYTPKLQSKLIRSGELKPAEALFQLKDDSGNEVIMHSGSVYWNRYRDRWIMIGVQIYGTSMLGEVWYLESDELTGPWSLCRKIVTHEKYSFYNPKQHPMLDKHDGRVIFFEGTYTNMFSGNEDPTPRYNYNQIMYKLDLSDPRLRLPAQPK